MPGPFDIDYELLVHWDLPVDCRTDEDEAWLNALMLPVVDMYNAFKANRDANLYELNHNGQVCYLEAVLNDAFDNASREIFISDPDYVDPVFLYRRDELKPVYLYVRSEAQPVYVYRRSECYDGGGVQFIVNVPAAVWAAVDHARFIALVDKYRLVSKKNYTIVTF